MGNKPKVTFVGAGIIGSGLAVNALLQGFPTILSDRILEEDVGRFLDKAIINVLRLQHML